MFQNLHRYSESTSIKQPAEGSKTQQILLKCEGEGKGKDELEMDPCLLQCAWLKCLLD